MTERITVSIKEFCAMSGLCRRTVYNRIADKTLKSVKIGRRHLIVLDHYLRKVGASHKAAHK